MSYNFQSRKQILTLRGVYRPKKYLYFSSNHVLAMTKKSCSNKKPFHYQSFSKVGVISKKQKVKKGFLDKKTLFSQT